MESSSGWKPNNVEISPNCPRCGSSNTKFCYYNNYSLTQPRYFCKGCRRYWTKGGSLRNVPVGGGCRKNRRGNNNKTLKQSIDGLTFKYSSSPSPCGDATDHNPSIGHSYDDPTRRNTNSSSVVTTDGPNIDLALVYANFLNQKPDSGTGVENQDQIQNVFDPSLENPNTEVGPSTLPQELGLTGCLNLPEQPSIESHFSDHQGNNQMYYSESNSMQTLPKDRIKQCSNRDDTMNFELPPLPGEEEASHDVMWSNSEMMMINHHPFQVSQTPILGAEVHHDADLLIGNWSPFDFPRDASFSRP